MLTMSTYVLYDVFMTKQIRKAWSNSPPLTFVSGLMLAAFVFSIAGLFLDSRIITGVPAWLKPAKFGISTAIFSGTMAWLFGFITVWPRLRRVLGWTLAGTLVFEVGIIDLQAARGTTSHFNIATGLDASLFAAMGVAILILWLSSIGVFVALMRQTFRNRAWGWALRSGMLITVLGASLGGLMTRTTPQQMQLHHLHQSVNANGAHTIGGPDGGPGLALVGWSTQHGDLRFPHFLGLHAIQIVPFLAWMVSRRRHALALTAVAATSYFLLIAILAWQALQGQPLTAPTGPILTSLLTWAGGTIVSAAALAKL